MEKQSVNEWLQYTENRIRVIVTHATEVGRVHIEAGATLWEGNLDDIPLADFSTSNPGMSLDGWHLTYEALIPLRHLRFAEIEVTTRLLRIMNPEELERLKV